MPDATTSVLVNLHRSNWVRLRTLVLLRWAAIAGQIVTVVIGLTILNLDLPIGLIVVTILASAVSNIVPSIVAPANRRLGETETVAILIFDIAQLAVLLGLTGGLHNPFALLILAPVTISATALRLRSTILSGSVAITSVCFLFALDVPLHTRDGQELALPPLFVLGFWLAICIGVIFQAAYSRRVTSETTAMSDALVATQMALAREQKLTDLGGVVAATAHELGTPLATITLVSGELADELDDPEHAADLRLIQDQAARCREILRSMGRIGKEDRHTRQAPISSIVEEAAEPHLDRGSAILFDVSREAGGGVDQPVVTRRPEIVHGVRNLIQNAVDFARSTVWINIHWNRTTLTIRIADDGPGYPPDLLPRLGDPFMRRRTQEAETDRRPGYEGMGLGVFIAKTLLERSGAELTFANGPGSSRKRGSPQRPGAIVEVLWPLEDIAVDERHRGVALGENLPLTP